MKNLTLFAKIYPKPEHFNDTRRALEAILPQTRAAKDCQYFTLHEDRDQAGALYSFEIGDDEAALEFHSNRTSLQLSQTPMRRGLPNHWTSR